MTTPQLEPTPRRGRRTALLATATTVAVLAIFAIVAYPIALELYWIRQLDRGAELPRVLDQLRRLRSRRAAPRLLEIAGLGGHGLNAGESSNPATAAREILQLLDLPDAFYLQHLGEGKTATRVEALRILRNRRSRAAQPALEAMIAARDPLAPIAAVSLAALQSTLTLVGVEETGGGRRAKLQVRNMTGSPLRVKRAALALYAREEDGFRHEVRPNLSAGEPTADDLVEPGAGVELAVSIDGLAAPFFASVTVEDAADRSARAPDDTLLPVSLEIFSPPIDPGRPAPTDRSRPAAPP